MIRTILPIAAAILCSTSGVSGFVVTPLHNDRAVLLLNAAATDESAAPPVVNEVMYDIPDQCYVVYPSHNAKSKEGEEEEASVVCTNNPEEYAWFNGIDAEDMIPADDGTSVDAMECREGESPRGIPEWECKTGGNLSP